MGGAQVPETVVSPAASSTPQLAPQPAWVRDQPGVDCVDLRTNLARLRLRRRRFVAEQLAGTAVTFDGIPLAVYVSPARSTPSAKREQL